MTFCAVVGEVSFAVAENCMLSSRKFDFAVIFGRMVGVYSGFCESRESSRRDWSATFFCQLAVIARGSVWEMLPGARSFLGRIDPRKRNEGLGE